ncbi:hypothetical protein [Patiriisocius hiemis]|uniref:Uncharacterized protein n=1 Tax=Patiriisocius hiemis TaxID=3075604 RepID=A0ABU2Y8T8_9FLAO|nr:hypothetical protein [Constantimarinum sp. W242]MDT0554581.1 hypothetical protein [Constantimarinum sp. W242]
MLSKTNIQQKLSEFRDKRVTEKELIDEVYSIFAENETQRQAISERLSNKETVSAEFNIEHLKTEKIYHIEDIKALCVTYRLRFLDSHFFKGTIPEEAISKIRVLEKEHGTILSNLKIVAPAKLLKLENADDPLLFAPMGNNYFYLIHKWGNDLHPLRKIVMWPYKSFENLILTTLLVSIFLTSITPMQAFTKGDVTLQEYFLMFLFMFKAVAGIVLYYGFAKGKNFNGVIWNSKYYNA